MPTRDIDRPSAANAAAADAQTSADLGRLMKHSSIYVIGGMLNRIGVFVLLPVYTSWLSLAEYGSLEMFYAVASVASGVLSAGLAHATLRFYFEYEDDADRLRVVSTNLVLGTSMGAAGALAIMLFREPLSQLAFGSPGASAGLVVMAVTMVMELSTQICLAYVRAREASGVFLAIVLSRLVVQVGVNSYAVIGLGAGVFGVLVGNSVAVGFGLLVAGAYTLRRCGVRVDMSKARPILQYSLPFVASTLVGLVASNIDRLFIRKLLSFEALGLFALALKFSRLPEQLIAEPFNRAYGAFRFSIMHQDNAAAIQARVVRLLLAATLFAALGIQFFATDALRWMSDASFRDATLYLPPLLLAAVLRVVTYPLQTGILVRRATRHLFHINLAKSTLYVVSSLVLIRSIGLLGVCLAMALTALFTMLATDRIAQRYLPVRYEWDRLGRIVLLTAATFFLGWPLLGVDSLIAVAAKAILLIAYPVVIVNSAAVDDEERAMARNWLGSVMPAGWTRHLPVGQEGA